MELLNIAELGAQVVLDAIVLSLVVKYLPNRDKEFLEMMHKHHRTLNRLSTAVINMLPEKAKDRQDISDEIFDDDEPKEKD